MNFYGIETDIGTLLSTIQAWNPTKKVYYKAYGLLEEDEQTIFWSYLFEGMIYRHALYLPEIGEWLALGSSIISKEGYPTYCTLYLGQEIPNSKGILTEKHQAINNFLHRNFGEEADFYTLEKPNEDISMVFVFNSRLRLPK